MYPYVSESFGGYAYTNNKTAAPETYDFSEGEQAKQDLLGLGTRARDEPSSLIFTSFEGDHLRFSDAYWNTEILPYLQ